MNFNKETIDKFISNLFEIDCIDICLTQKTDKDPIKYTGPGTIYQDEHGILQLKLYSKLSDINKELSHQFKHHPLGKIIAEDNYFTLRAIDMSGNEWLADNIWISVNVSFPAAGLVIKSKLDEIKTIELNEARSNTEKNYLFIIVPGQHKIPCNEKEDLPNGGWRLNRAVFSANEIDFEFRKYDDYLIIYANAKTENLDKDVYLKLIEALSIITGLIVRPIVIRNTQKDKEILKIKSVDNSFTNKELSPPFKHFTTTEFESFTCFLEKYLANIKAPFSDLFGFWHKINRAWQASIENSSLSIGVAIEGIVKSYFSELGLPDKKILQQAKEAEQKIKDSDLGERIKGYLLSSIGLLKNTSTKSALSQMVKKGLLNNAMKNEWVKLRNKSVHPDKMNQDPNAVQVYIDRIYTCLTLFYRLLFIIIKYEGSYMDYSESKWPEKKFKLKNE
ncbi:MAG: hypothetical protein MUP69_11480 [Candidatus Atribacteria bacterium]|nr:hypothetical protein [Candidatus Atribacteria bacterium]